LQKIEAGDQPTKYLLGRYAHPEIKAALLAETNEKCAYCESPLRHVTYGDVEHIVPKAAQPTLRFSWRNLTIACDVCNTNKSNVPDLVDPYECDPRQRFKFYGPLLWAVPTDDPAVLTEEQLDLNRGKLVERRCERIEYLRNLVASASTKPAAIRDAMLRRADREVDGTKPFSACTSTALAHLRALHGL
jgi:uncharacterized protein (TIGR02646 family)